MRGNKFDKQMEELYQALKERKRKAEENMENKYNKFEKDSITVDSNTAKEMKEVNEVHIKASETKLCPPWVEYYNKLKCMFDADPEINLTIDKDHQRIVIRVDNGTKAEALRELLPYELTFGNVEWALDIVLRNGERSRKNLLLDALHGNPNFRGIVTPMADTIRPFTFFVFARKVAQYYNDDIGDVYGNRSLLYSDLAKELFGSDQKDGIRFCTDVFDDECDSDDE